jgi:thiol:disulfide interchange protein DsbA
MERPRLQPPERIRLQRRHFSTLAAASLGLGLTRLANAQGPITSQDYKPVAMPVVMTAPAGQVDVVEFFSYACPHCNDFEPVLEAWLRKKPAGIHFHRYPVRFLQNAANFQPMYFALEAMDQVDAMQQKIFDAVHKEGQRLDKPDAIAAFMARNGLDAKRFMSLFTSFSVRTKVQQANQMMETFGIDSVPTIVVDGKWYTSPADAKGEERTTQVVEYLAAKARGGH